jgi:cobalamin synthase
MSTVIGAIGGIIVAIVGWQLWNKIVTKTIVAPVVRNVRLVRGGSHGPDLWNASDGIGIPDNAERGTSVATTTLHRVSLVDGLCGVGDGVHVGQVRPK